jgi:two-component system invasion response regulator UvrY
MSTTSPQSTPAVSDFPGLSCRCVQRNFPYSHDGEGSVAIRVVLVDDHAPFRSYLATLLAQQAELVVVGEAEALDSLLQLLASLDPAHAPDVLLVDVEIPGCGGPAITSAVLTAHPTLRVLALSMHDDPVFVAAMLAAGARGYILKDDLLTDIVAAIRDVASGREFFSAGLGNIEVRSPHRTD